MYYICKAVGVITPKPKMFLTKNRYRSVILRIMAIRCWGVLVLA